LQLADFPSHTEQNLEVFLSLKAGKRPIFGGLKGRQKNYFIFGGIAIEN
jgi:hypothetical protein